MADNYEELAKTTLDARFAYCGLDHPLLSLLYKKTFNNLLNQKAMGTTVSTQSLCQFVDDITLPKLPDESSLKEISQLDPMELIKQDGQLPPLPAVLYELQRVVQDELSDAETVAKVVRSDAGLSTFLLRLVNSAFYSFPARIDTITRAVAMVGTRPLYLLSVGILFQDLINAVPKNSLNIASFWRHSIAVGLAAQEIWREMGHKEDERLFTAGLLHDIGKLALACLLPRATDLHQHILVKCRKVPPCEIERELLGFDHSRFGGMLLRKWNMPASLAMPVLWHHQPQSAAHYKEPIVVHLADIIATAMGITVVPGSVVPKLDAGVWEMVGLNLETIDYIVDSVSKRMMDVCQIFGVQAKK